MRSGILSISPCIPPYLDEYSIRYEYGTSTYNITVRNLSKNKPNVVKRFLVNGEEILDKKIKLIDNGRIYEVIAEL